MFKESNTRKIVVIAHDMRSAHNVGSLLRTAEGLGVGKVYLTGYTPHPSYEGDPRLPHVSRKQTSMIQKTALGAEASQDWSYIEDISWLVADLKDNGYVVVALEQTPDALPLHTYKPTSKVAVLLGREVEGLDRALVSLCDDTVVIPMSGAKESFNVVQAAAMALYQLRFAD